MNRVQMLKGIQKKKISQAKAGKHESEWDDRFYLGKIQDHDRAMKQTSQMKQNQYQINNSVERKNIHGGHTTVSNKEEENIVTFDLDQDIIDLWNTLHVTQEYRIKFQHKLWYFKDTLHCDLCAYEKESLKQIADLISTIKSETDQRDLSMIFLRKFNDSLKKDSNLNTEEQIVAEIKECLKNIKTKNMILISLVNTLRRLTHYDAQKGKFDLTKMDYALIFDSGYLLKFNQEIISFICNGPIASLLKLKINNDPLLMDLTNSNEVDYDKKLLTENCYIMLNDMIYTNYIQIKGKGSAKSFNFNQSHNSNSKTKFYINQSGVNPKKTSNYSLKKEELSKASADKRNNNNNIQTKLVKEEKYIKKAEKDVIDCNKEIIKEKESFRAQGKEKDVIMSKDKEQNKNRNKDLLQKESKTQNSNRNDNNYPKNYENSDSDKELNLPEVNDDYIINDKEGKELPNVKKKIPHISNKDTIESTSMELYTESIFSFNTTTYSHYYTLIPDIQKITFSLSKDLSNSLNGIYPILIVNYKNKALTSLCLLETDNEDVNILKIIHISTIEDNISEMFLKMLHFIEDNFQHKEISIDLHYEHKDSKLILNKELCDIIQGLNFKWSRLENFDNGHRIQTMKLKTRHTTQRTMENNDTYFNISSAMVGWSNQDPSQNQMNNDYNKINSVNKQVITSLINNTAKSGQIKDTFSYLSKFKGTQDDTINFFKENGFNPDDIINQFEQEKDELYASCFTLSPMFKTMSSNIINRFIYNRIKTKNEVLYEKEINQTFYISEQADYILIIGEISPGFKKILDSNCNIYQAFNSIYAKIDNVQTKETILWVPSFTMNEKLTCPLFEENNGGDVKTDVCAYTNVSFSPGKDYKKSIMQELNDGDAIISDSFFVAIISGGLLSSFDLSSAFCAIIDSSKWKSV